MGTNKVKEVDLKERLNQYLSNISDGKLTIVNQDGQPIQFNVNKRYALDSRNNAGIGLVTDNDLQYISSILSEIRFGALAITLKDGKIEGIEREEKFRVKI